MFAADAYFEFGFNTTAFFNAHADELADTFLVENFKWIGLDDAVFFVEFQELGCIIARETEGHLGEVIGAEREEVCNSSDLVGGKSRTGNFDHSADEVRD